MPEINPTRLLGDLRTLATFGTYKTGVHRPSLSEEDVAARRWLVRQLRDINFAAEIDGIANVHGISPAKGRKVLAGSHLESQNYAGWLDGALGVIYALEAARTIAASETENGVDVVGLFDEEGHFGSFLGSRSFLGQLTDSEIDAAFERTAGTKLRDALASAELTGRARRVLEPSRYSAFLEAHIEQGDVLENAHKRIGVVTSIVAIWQYQIVVTGEQNHAGTTSMKRRRDAGAALVELLHKIGEEFRRKSGPRSVWTVGKITLEPGAKSIIPGKAEALFQFRDASVDILDRMEKALSKLVEEFDRSGPCRFELVRLSASRPAPMDPALQTYFEKAAEKRARHG